ncbi:MAG TPA: D-2-hydroxyacid dehydrogenase family protein [Solirubrobacteraceae bacterium]|nr:D-2-hydroxyacid dehydrogenase family protein [Solirubrobacteraceae bacterium]
MRVAVLDDYLGGAAGWADWSTLGPEVEVEFFGQPICEDRLAQTLEPFEVIVAMRERTRFPRSLVRALPRLELLVTTGMRNAALDLDALRERGVTVCGTDGTAPPGVPGVASTVEVAWALILAVAKRVTIEDRAIRRARWQTGMPATLGGATLGLIGLGRLGSAMVGPARAFGMEPIAWSANLTAERAQAVGARAVELRELLSRSDFVSIHLVLSERTRGLLGERELAQMKRTAALINTSRGPIVDEAALVCALRDGTIAGAGLDVYDREPLPEGHPLTTLENVVLLPHLGYVSEAGMRHMYSQVVEDIAAHLAGAPIRVIAGG